VLIVSQPPPSGWLIGFGCSDMSMNIWDTENDDALVQRCEHHTEFVVGLDFNIFIEGQVSSCGRPAV